MSVRAAPLPRLVEQARDASLVERPRPPMSSLRARLVTLSREPLVRFVAAGLVLAGLDAMAAPATDRESAPAERTLVIDEDVSRAIAEDWQHAHERAPSEAELEAAREAWIDQELLYREGILRGLDRDDPAVRGRVATLAAARLEAEHPLAEPTDDDLRGYFEAHVDRYAEDARVDFEQVFVAGTDAAARARAEALLRTLADGASPIGLGDTYPGGRRYRGRRRADLAEAFGARFADEVSAADEEVWTLASSPAGWHLVRVIGRSAASPADFERARLDVAHDLLEERREARSERTLEALRARWRVIAR